MSCCCFEQGVRYEQDEAFLAEHLYGHNHTGSNLTVRRYLDSVCRGVKTFKQSQAYTELNNVTPFNLIEELSKSYGVSGLCLSGGAGNAYYHLGVVKALLENNCLPKHVSGASGGAMIASMVCTHTEKELKDILSNSRLMSKMFNPCENETFWKMLKRWKKTGACFDQRTWSTKLKNQIIHGGDTTFLEAFHRTGRTLTITVFSGEHSVCLNHITTPHVVIYSAVLASSALPLFLEQIELFSKSPKTGKVGPDHALGRFWRDGSFKDELPFEAMKQMFNVGYTIVSQVEPHLIPFFYSNRGSAGELVEHKNGRGWRGGFVMSYLEKLFKMDLIKWLKLVRDFDLCPHIFGSDVSSIFLGKTYGDCTLVPPLRIKDYFQLISDPGTTKEIRRYVWGGEKAVWRKLAMLKDRMRLENCLQKYATKSC